MPPRPQPILENQTARDILAELIAYGTDKDRGFQPLQSSLFLYMTEREWNPVTKDWNPGRYPKMTRGEFNHWFDRLADEGYIAIDKATRSVRATALVFSERTNGDF